MTRFITALSLILGIAFSGQAQQIPLDTIGITNGSVHMKGSFPYTKFFKKHKGDKNLVIHVWYNPSSSVSNKKEVKAGADEIHFFYGRNLRSSSSEMEFKLGSSASKTLSKKKEKELQELIDFLEFDVFPGQHFNGTSAMEALNEALK